jgi:hypothetical protein
MRSVSPWFLLLVAACSSTPSPSVTRLRPGDVGELAALPAGYRVGESLRVSCSRAPRAIAFEAETLASVDCNVARLSRVLRARAGELSGPFIIGKACHARGGARGSVECSAKVAHPGSSVGFNPYAEARDPGPAPSAEQVLDLDEPRPQDDEQIHVAYAPTALGERGAFAPRSYAAVDETHLPSVGRRELGEISAECANCAALQLRHALRVTAGHVGAGEVTAVKCFQDDGALRCVATALTPWSS